jgi:hypothetical protein
MKKNILMTLSSLALLLSASHLSLCKYEDMDPQERMARIDRKEKEAQAKRQKDTEKANIKYDKRKNDTDRKYQEKKADIRYKERVDEAKLREDKNVAHADMQQTRRYYPNRFMNYSDLEKTSNAERTADTSLFR